MVFGLSFSWAKAGPEYGASETHVRRRSGTEMHYIEWKGMNDWMDGWIGWSNRDNANQKFRKQTNSM